MDVVVCRRRRKLEGGGGGRGGWWRSTVVQGFVQDADVIGRCAADHTLLLRAGRGSCAGSWRLLVRGVNTGVGVMIGDGVHVFSSRLVV